MTPKPTPARVRRCRCCARLTLRELCALHRAQQPAAPAASKGQP